MRGVREVERNDVANPWIYCIRSRFKRPMQTQWPDSTSTSEGKTSPAGTGNPASIHCLFNAPQRRAKACFEKRKGNCFFSVAARPKVGENIVRRSDAEAVEPDIPRFCQRHLPSAPSWNGANLSRRRSGNPLACSAVMEADATAKIRARRAKPSRLRPATNGLWNRCDFGRNSS